MIDTRPEIAEAGEGNTMARRHDYRGANGQYVSLKDYFDARLTAMDEAVSLARESMETRLEGMNEFRTSLKEQADKFITRLEHFQVEEAHGQIHKGIAEDIRMLRESKAELQGKASQTAVMLTMIIAFLGLFTAIMSTILAVLYH